MQPALFHRRSSISYSCRKSAASDNRGGAAINNRLLKTCDVRDGSRLCENSDVELARRNFASIRLIRSRTALAVSVERRNGRKQFCAFSARARFHTAWVNSVSLTTVSYTHLRAH